MFSPTFEGPVSGTEWDLYLCPNGLDENNGKPTGKIAIYLRLCNSSGPVDISSFTICIVNSDIPYTIEREVSKAVTLEKYESYGFPNAGDREMLLDEENGYLVEDKLTIALTEFTIREYEPLPKGEGVLSKHLKLLDSGEYSDCTLICNDDIEVRACRFLLASQSPVFHAMFKSESGTSEAQTGIVEIDDFNSDCMLSLVRYTCRGKPSYLGVPPEVLFAAADKYQMTELRQMCIQEILNTMHHEYEICCRLIVAYRHNVVSVKEAAIKFIKESGRELKDFDEYAKLLLVPDIHAELLSALDCYPELK